MGLRETFDVLANSRSADIKPALFEAIELQHPKITQLALDALFAQKIEADDVIELVDHLEGLSDVVQERLAATVMRFKEPLKELVRHGTDKERAALLDLLTRNTSVDVADLLVMYLASEDEEHVKTAAAQLERVVNRFIAEAQRTAERLEEEEDEDDSSDEPDQDSDRFKIEERQRLDMRLLRSALTRGLESFPDHKQNVVVRLALKLGQPGWEMLMEAVRHEGRTHNVRDFLIDEIVSQKTPETIKFALMLMESDQGYYRKVGCDIIRGKKSEGDADAVIKTLIRTPRGTQRRLIRRCDDMPWIHLLRGRFTDLGEDYAEFALDEIEGIAKAAVEKIGLWYFLAQCANRKVATVAIAHLTKINAPEAKKSIELLVEHGDEFAQLACIALMEEQGSPNFVKVVAKKLDSEYESVRELAGKALATQGYQRYRNAFEKLDATTRELAGKTLLKINDHVVAQLVEDLNHIDPAKRILGIRIIQSTNMEEQMQEHIHKLLTDADSKVRATTVKLLAGLRNKEALTALVKCLSDKDLRVQANAVEAIEMLNPEQYRQILVPLLKHTNNRVRGNAAKALWKLGIKDVLPFLKKFLSDENPKMRATGAWLMQECGPQEAEAWLAEAIKKEIVAAVRSRMVEAYKALQSGSDQVGREATDVLDDDELAGLGFG